MNREQLKTLCALEGISGREQAVRAYLQQQLRDLPAVESMTVDPLGNLIVRVKGQQRAAR